MRREIMTIVDLEGKEWAETKPKLPTTNAGQVPRLAQDSCARIRPVVFTNAAGGADYVQPWVIDSV